MIAPAAGEMSLQLLRLLVNAYKPADPRSIFLFLIGSLLLSREPCKKATGGERRLTDCSKARAEFVTGNILSSCSIQLE